MSTEQKKTEAVDMAGSGKAPTKKDQIARERERERDVGHALRSIYQKTIDEAVPPEMLDLLGKLG